MKTLFNHNVPAPLARLKDGALLTAAENAGFEILLSGDKTIRHEQNMKDRRIAMICMSDNHWRIVKDCVSEIQDALDTVQAGEVRAVYCGRITRGKSPPKPR